MKTTPIQKCIEEYKKANPKIDFLLWFDKNKEDLLDDEEHELKAMYRIGATNYGINYVINAEEVYKIRYKL